MTTWAARYPGSAWNDRPRSTLNHFSGVMAGLVLAAHVLLRCRKKDVDARDERGHDAGEGDSISSERGLASSGLIQLGVTSARTQARKEAP